MHVHVSGRPVAAAPLPQEPPVPFRFWLGANEPSWLSKLDVPPFVSRSRLARLKALPRARGDWALDSGAFSELLLRGRFTAGPRQYAAEVRRFADEVGRPAFVSIQDWMCEPFILKATGLTVRTHQKRTVQSYVELCLIAPEIPWVPVLQGWQPDEYLRNVEDYRAAGADLDRQPLVGLGSVCRRQGTAEAASLVARLHRAGLVLHAFGFKRAGLVRVAHLLASADSMAWSYVARKQPRLEGCRHACCNNCPRFALRWREELMQGVAWAYAAAA